MEIDVRYDEDRNRIDIEVSGAHDPESAVDAFGSLLAANRLQNATRILIDYRKLEGRGSATNEVLYATRIVALYQEYLAAGGVPFRIAYLGTEAFIQGWVPGVDIAREGGLDAIATVDPVEAEDFLAAP